MYQYTCDECGTKVKSYTPHTCNGCKMNLCDKCNSKHKFHLCQWCYDEIPVELKAKRRTAIIMMIITPILFLLIPVPKPALFMFYPYDQRNLLQIIIIIALIIVSLIAYPIVLGINKKQMMKSLKAERKVNTVAPVEKKDVDPKVDVDSSTIDPYKSLNVSGKKMEEDYPE